MIRFARYLRDVQDNLPEELQIGCLISSFILGIGLPVILLLALLRLVLSGQ